MGSPKNWRRLHNGPTRHRPVEAADIVSLAGAAKRIRVYCAREMIDGPSDSGGVHMNADTAFEGRREIVKQ